MKQKLKLILMLLSIVLALFALWQVENVAQQVRQSEESKIRLWANAIAQRNRMAAATNQFFQEATLDEQRKIRLYTDILQSFNDPDQTVDLRFSLAYVNYIIDSAKTPIVITGADSIITVPGELAGQKLEGRLLEDYSQNPPFHYNLWGMPMTLYYKESHYYTQLREVLTSFSRSFLEDITNNSVIVPVVIVDSSRTRPLAHGNIDPSEIDTPDKLAERLSSMESMNDPIAITLPDNSIAYVYYENSQLLKALRWVPLFYFFIALVLLVVAYTQEVTRVVAIVDGSLRAIWDKKATPIEGWSIWEGLRGQNGANPFTIPPSDAKV